MTEKNKSTPCQQLADNFIQDLVSKQSLLFNNFPAGEIKAPANAVSGKSYSGLNRLLLSQGAVNDPRWFTKKQALEAGYSLNDNAQGRKVIYWDFKEEKHITDENGQFVLDENGQALTETVKRERPAMRFYTVYHASEMHMGNGQTLPPYEAPVKDFDMEKLQGIVKASGVNIEHDQKQLRSFYRGNSDSIHMMPQENYPDEKTYAADVLKGVIRASRHKERLNRPCGPHGTEDYAREELRVALSAMMLAQDFNLPFSSGQNENYARSWVEILKKDPYELNRASRDAEQAKEYVMGFEKKQKLGQGVTSQTASQNSIDDSAAKMDQAMHDAVIVSLINSSPKDIQAVMNSIVHKTQAIMDSPDFGRPGTEVESKLIEMIHKRAAVAATVDETSINRLDVLQHAQHGIILAGHIKANRDGSTNQAAMQEWLKAYYVEINELGQSELDLALGRNVSFKQEFDGGRMEWCFDQAEQTVLCRANSNTPWREPTEDELALLDDAGDFSLVPIVKLDDGRIMTYDGNVHGTDLQNKQERMHQVINDFEKKHLQQQPQNSGIAVDPYDDGPYKVIAYRMVTQDDGEQPLPWIKAENKESALFFAIESPDGSIVQARSTLSAAMIEADSYNFAVETQRPLPLPLIGSEKIYLDVPYMEKNIVKELGATWDKGKKSWSIRPGVDVYKLMKWIPQQEHNKVVSIVNGETKDLEPELATEKTYLHVPYKDKETAKDQGAKWDSSEKLWYVPEGTDLNLVAKWLPENTPTPDKSATMGPQEEFAQALEQAGLKISGLPVMDGKIHRVGVDGGKSGSLDGAYCAYLDGRPNGWIQNHKSGEKIKWMATGQVLTEEQKNALKLEAIEKLAERERERQSAYEKSILVASKKYLFAEQPEKIDDHPYLVNKGVKAFQIKQDAYGNLLIPGYNISTPYRQIKFANNIQTIQTITPDGKKMFEQGCPKKGAMGIIDPQNKMDQDTCNEILLTEGYATGASLHMATGKPVAVAFDAGNLKDVAIALREKFPETKITICADNDHKANKNVGLEKAQEAAQAVKGYVVAPEFNAAEKVKGLTDFNDLHQARGLEALVASFGRKQTFTLDQVPVKQKIGMQLKSQSEGVSR